MCHLSLQVGADPHHASLDSHLEGEADDPFDLQKSLLTQAAPGLRDDTITTHTGPKDRQTHTHTQFI